MAEHLSVDPAGLRAASIALGSQAQGLTTAEANSLSGNKPSVSGARAFAAGVEAFAGAYGSRLSRHGTSMAEAGTRYAASDVDGSEHISSVSL